MRKITVFSAIVCSLCVFLSACSDLGSIHSSRGAVVSLKISDALFSETSAGTAEYTVDAVLYDADTDTVIESLSKTVSLGGSAVFTFSPVEAGRAVILGVNVYDSDGAALYMSGKSARYVVVEGDQTVDITLTKVQDVTAPADVTDLSAAAGDGSITLSWTEPSDSDYAGVKIYNGEDLSATVMKGTIKKEITGLTNGTSYTFTVKTYDSTGNVSAGKKITAAPAVVEDVTDYVDSESDLETCIADSVIEYYTFFKSLNSSRAAATSDDATKQAEAFFDVLFENSSAITEFIKDFDSGIKTSTGISFDKTVDLSDLTVENGLTSFVDTYNYIESKLSPSGTAITKDSLIQKIADEAGITTTQADALYTALNKYAEINTLYLRAKLDVDAAAEGSSTYASAEGSVNGKLTVTDVNALLLSVLQNTVSYSDTTLSLPVSAVSYAVKGDISASITADNYAAAAEITDPASVDWNTYLPVSASCGVTAGVKVCTRSGLGGNITFSADISSFTTQDLYTVSNLQQQLDDGVITEETYKQNLYSLLDSIMKYTITVTDDSGNTKWTADYTLEELESVEKAVSEKISAGL